MLLTYVRTADGQVLAASSADGYISFLLFTPGELGSVLDAKEMATLAPAVVSITEKRERTFLQQSCNMSSTSKQQQPVDGTCTFCDVITAYSHLMQCLQQSQKRITLK